MFAPNTLLRTLTFEPAEQTGAVAVVAPDDQAVDGAGAPGCRAGGLLDAEAGEPWLTLMTTVPLPVGGTVAVPVTFTEPVAAHLDAVRGVRP